MKARQAREPGRAEALVESGELVAPGGAGALVKPAELVAPGGAEAEPGGAEAEPGELVAPSGAGALVKRAELAGLAVLAARAATRRGLVELPVQQASLGFRSPHILCPSVPASSPGARLLAVAGEGGARYLEKPLPVSPELLALAAPAAPEQVFRFAGPCAETGCHYFRHAHCRLAESIARERESVLSALPRCPIRRRCRWFGQEGRAACLRCPGVVTRRRVGPRPNWLLLLAWLALWLGVARAAGL